MRILQGVASRSGPACAADAYRPLKSRGNCRNMATTEARAGAGSSRASANMAPPASIPAASTTTRSEHGRASRHEESGLMSDEDFYDAQEDLEADASRQASVGGFWVALYGQEAELLAAIVPSNKQAGGPELEDKRIDPDDSKYIVKNKDTGEVFDIRDLASMPADSYSIFPNDFVAPQEEEVRGYCDHNREIKQRSGC
ncbi:hypothetical protein GQ600_16454 [Phytophthora cactorum]|nr:hypothetical protein GQ600_16454 [Phytophthora cactorum]